MRYGSVCSGIEAASVAWEPLGWQPAWFSEIEAFPSAVLAQRWPEVSNLGDMTKIAAAVRAGEVEAPDAVVGGTPCQAFSVAGLRKGLSDARGQLTLSYVELADAIDDKRRERSEKETIFVWENVPGVLSSKDNAFGCFIGALAGESCELQPAGGKWPNAGCVYGPSRIVAWRVLDAQFFGVAQRRRRVFVVASAREGFDPAAVLFEFESVRRDTPPRREPQTAVAALTANGVGTCGADDNQGQAGHLIAECVSGKISHTLKADGFDGSEDGTGRGTPVIAFGGGNTSGNIDVAACLTAKGQRIDFDVETFAVHGTQDPDTSHANGGQSPAICIQHASIGRHDAAGPQGKGYQEDLAFTQDSRSSADVVQFGMQVRRLTPRECERLQGFPDDHTLIEYGRKISLEKMDRDFAKYLMRGGKLTFEECCGRAADGPRYKAIGNSMAVPVMRWIGERISTAAKVIEPAAPARTLQRPFLKWAGGKFSLLGELDKHIPAGKRLIEPFVGGGSVFLNSDKHAQFLLADVNADLINLYQMLAAVPDEVSAAARHMFELLNTAEDFDAIKVEFNGQCLNAVERAAALLYLNRHCFNGLIRYNQRHEFNVGYGKYKSPYFPESEIAAFSGMAHNCVFLNADFSRTLALAGSGDVVYCDPPYEPLPGADGFTGYAAGGFKWDHQVALVEHCVAAHQRGAQIVISNSTAPKIVELYEQHGFELVYVDGRRTISCNGAREPAKDLIATLKVKP